MSPAVTALAALALAATAPRPAAPRKKAPPAEVLVLAAVPGAPGEPAFPLLCVRAGAAAGLADCPPPVLGGAAARTPEGSRHLPGRVVLRAPCEGGGGRHAGVLLDPPPPTGPFLAVLPAESASKLKPAAALPTRVPDPAALAALGQAVGGTPVLDQALVVDLDGDGREDVLWAVHAAGGEPRARLVASAPDAPGAWRELPLPLGAARARVLYVSDLDGDGALELVALAELPLGWALVALEGHRAQPLGELRCAPEVKSGARPPPAP